jgi:rhodanese-related sulfurtransferase
MHMLEPILNDPRRAEEYFANKNAFTTGPVEVSRRIEKGENIVIIDVREEEDFRKGHVPGAVSLPESQWQTLQGLCKDVPNILYCYSQTCHLASRAAQLFSHEGYMVMEMEGGFEAWEQNRLQLER